MEKDTTRTLSKALEKIHMSEEADQFIEKHSQSDFAYFYEYLNWIIAKKELTTAEVITRSGVNKNYVYNILNGDKKKAWQGQDSGPLHRCEDVLQRNPESLGDWKCCASISQGRAGRAHCSRYQQRRRRRDEDQFDLRRVWA